MMNTLLTQGSLSEPNPRLKRFRSRNHRAVKACMSCRSRKVRCDAMARNGQPCTNCSLDSVPCEIAPRVRKNASQPATKTSILAAPCHDHSLGAQRELNNMELSSITIQPAVNGPLSASSPKSDQDPRSPQHASILDQGNLDPGSQPTEATLPTTSPSNLCIPADTENNQLVPQSHVVAATPILTGFAPTHPVRLESPSLDFLHDVEILFQDTHCDMPDSEILAQYMNLTDVFNPYTSEYNPSPGNEMDSQQRLSDPRLPTPPTRDKSSFFKSPWPWIADWSAAHLKDDDSWVAVVEKKVFNVPSHSEISTLIGVYFTYAHQKLPVLQERHFYLLTNQHLHANTESTVPPISLALLYAVMFAACPYLATESLSTLAYSTIRARRCEYYSRAALLFKLGCEADPLRKIQICLLLSTYRSYPNSFHENERWIIAAYRILQEVGVMPFNRITSSPDSSSWKRASVCLMDRFTSLIVGLKWTSNPEFTAALSSSWSEISLQDFEDDYSFSWYLSADVKQHLMRVFVASVGLHIHMGSLGKLLLRYTSVEMQAMGLEQGNAILADIPNIEDIELELEIWKTENALIMEAEPPPSLPPSEIIICQTNQIILKLSYEYVMSTLYQSTLIIKRSNITKWAARIIEVSRTALWESVVRIMEILRNVVAKDYIHLLPSNHLVVVIIPLTIYHLYVKRTVHFNHSAIENLSTCTKILQKMTERYDVADFFCELLGKCLELAEHHQRLSTDSFGTSPSSASSTRVFSDSSDRVSAIEQNSLLPEPELHSWVIRFQNLALSLGSMPPMDVVTRQR